jgi:hypothetical protein
MGMAGCRGERQATGMTTVASAEVKTPMPNRAVSDQQLQRASDQAAQLARTQATAVVPVNPDTQRNLARHRVFDTERWNYAGQLTKQLIW